MAEAGNLRRRRLGFLRRKRRSQKATAMSMMEHLRELRTRLIVSLAAFGVLSVVTFILFPQISDFLLRPLCSLPADKLGPQGCELISIGPLEPFMVRLKVTALSALVLASPLWLYQVWAFVAPGLTKGEKRYATPFVLSSLTLFLGGATFAYLSLPRGLELLVDLGGGNLVPFFRAGEYLNFVGLMLIAFGITFELPLVLFFLGLAGVVTVEQLRRQRKGAFVGIVALSAVVTPSQDPYTMLVLAAPLYGMYELVIGLLALRARRR